jgi:hypothetical protein
MVMAALVTILALNSSAHAKVIHHSVDIVIDDITYNLDLNGDGVVDFSITSYENFNRCAGNAQVNETSLSANGTLLGPLHLGDPIGPQQVFGGGGNLETAWYTNGLCYLPSLGGLWASVTSGYLGFSLQVRGQTYYGWAKLINQKTPSADVSVKLVEYAYENTPGMAIDAGQTQ